MLYFLVSHFEKQQVKAVAILITPHQQDALSLFRERFGPWMFLGVKQLSEQQLLNSYSSYLPQQVIQALQSNQQFNYSCELQIAIEQ